MSKCKPIAIAAIVMLGSACLVAFVVQRKATMTSTSEIQSIPLKHLVHELGTKYDRYFTIENAWADGESVNSMEASPVQRHPTAESLVQELESLKKDVPNLTYELGQANSRIVHIIDSRLSRQKDYAMDRVIPSIDFDGTVDRLADGLAKQGVPISPFSFRISVDPAEDRVTVVHIKAKNLQVRDALSDFIPLDRQNKILWVARTRLGPGETSYVGFQGGPREAAK